MRNIVRGAACAAILCAGLASTPARAAKTVEFEMNVAPGTIVIVNHERRLYYVTAPGVAVRYPVGVGKNGKRWTGRSYVDGKYVDPPWSPPADVKHDHPNMPEVIPGGSPHNPMGARALTLVGGDYAIHGTTKSMRRSVGTYASYGCIRMYNEDVIDLYSRVQVGTPVVVIP